MAEPANTDLVNASPSKCAQVKMHSVWIAIGMAPFDPRRRPRRKRGLIHPGLRSPSLLLHHQRRVGFGAYRPARRRVRIASAPALRLDCKRHRCGSHDSAQRQQCRRQPDHCGGLQSAADMTHQVGRPDIDLDQRRPVLGLPRARHLCLTLIYDPFRSIAGSLVRPLPEPLQIPSATRSISPIACFIRYKGAAPAVVRIQPGERHAAEPPTT